ncbi:UNVERIFIED_CONTAM: hypothetical protein RMT77_003366 [Armadillidium vulgare]
MIYLLVFNILSIIYAQRNDEFCKNQTNKEILYCAKGAPDDLGKNCPSNASNVRIQQFSTKDALKDLNDKRKKMAEGKTILQREEEYLVRFPSAGDMMKLEWDKDLTLLAEMVVRNCPDESEDPPTPETLHVPGTQKVDLTYYNTTSKDIIYEKSFWEEALQKWKEEDLEPLIPFARPKSVHSVLSILYGKHHLVGCGKLTFHNDKSNENEGYMVCAFGRRKIENTPIKFGTKKCESCVNNSMCEEMNLLGGRYYKILCLYGEGSVKITDRLTIVFAATITFFSLF